MKTALMIGMLPMEYQKIIMVNGLAKNQQGEEDLSMYDKQRGYIITLVENNLENTVPKADTRQLEEKEWTKGGV